MRQLLVAVVAAAGLALLLAGGVLASDRVPSELLGRTERPGAAGPGEPPLTVPVVSEPVTVLADAPFDPTVAQGAPVRVSIDRLGVSVPVVEIEAEGGVLTPPADPQVLGWWRGGAQAGAATGSAVVTGHTVSRGGGALDRLRTLRTGDVVVVRTTGGRLDYVVRKVTDLTKDQLARRAQEVFSGSVPGRLVLITCTDWNGSEYLGNTVVYAQPVTASS